MDPSAQPLENLERKSDMKIIWRLKGYGLRYKWRLLAAYASMTLSVLLSLMIPLLLGQAIDEALYSGLRSQLISTGLTIFAIGLVRGLLTYGQHYFSYGVTERAARDLRNDSLDRLLHLSSGFFDRHRTGDLMSRLASDIPAVQFVVGVGMVRITLMPIMMIGVATIMLSMNWRLALVSFCLIGSYTYSVLRGTGPLNKMWERFHATTGEMNAIVQENITGMRVVKAFDGGKQEEAKFEASARNVAESHQATGKFTARRSSFLVFTTVTATGIVLWLGGNEVGAGRITTGELSTFLLYMTMLISPIDSAVQQILGLSRVKAAGRRILDILDEKSPVQEKRGALSMPLVNGHVKFENVTMGYGSGEATLHSIDFEAAPGTLVAILGGPGSGKTTIAHLLPRFYDVTSGRVTIDGYDVRDVTLESLRRNVGIVLQDVFVFAGTFQENIAYGVEESTEKQIIDAARVAQLHDFIANLKDGYDTVVGERGIRLSGGQRQRLAIARTILRNPPILILDDSTSSVDMKTEHELQQALTSVMEGRTTLVIAHRLSTVRAATTILVVEDGEIVQQGTHDDLIREGGYYQLIYESQLIPKVEQALRQESEVHRSSEQ